jgi:phospholipid/cholesterol/gamma-HCH transport system permease protein
MRGAKKIRLVSRSRCNQASGKMTPAHRRNWLIAGYFSENASAYLRILADAFLHIPAVLRPPCLRVLLKQVYFNGIESLPFLSLTALLLGFAASSRLYQVMSKDLSRTVDVFRSMIVQEGAVLVVAFYVMARSGSAIASELASCKQHGEVAALYRMGIDPAEYLIAPRVLGCMLSVSALTIFFQIVLVLGGFALASFFMEWDYALAMKKFLHGGISPEGAFFSLLKTSVFGALIGAVACQQGLRAVRGPQGIPVATRTAVVHGFAAIVLASTVFFLLSK